MPTEYPNTEASITFYDSKPSQSDCEFKMYRFSRHLSKNGLMVIAIEVRSEYSHLAR